MQRDMNLIREIMFRVEQHPEGFAPKDFTIDGYTREQVRHHVWLLGQADLMKVADITSMGSSGFEAIPISLTWAGHDFIDSARNDTTWSEALAKVKSVGGSLSFALLKQVLEALLKNQLGL